MPLGLIEELDDLGVFADRVAKDVDDDIANRDNGAWAAACARG